MHHHCVLVADGARARFFAMERDVAPHGEARYLAEQTDIVNPEQKLQASELFDNRRGSNRNPPAAAPSHGYDDHRDDHQEEIERRFVRRVAEKAAELATQWRSKQLIVAAQPKALGLLRAELESRIGNGTSIRCLDKDLSKLSPEKIHEHLAEANLLPPPRRPGRPSR